MKAWLARQGVNDTLAARALFELQKVAIVVHELLHLAEPNHGERFVALMNRHLPRWAATQKRLNAAPLGHEEWEV